ncbi:hypothetical protein GP475_02905 [Corynebacterium poyangense]|uniref:Uncharacterized protein n=1 Tax=Corynebacterium poyangense TaxID=2684405 RepID=A0A7H0SMD5_9CORY|nr:hypothetical protein [Corynebacterium poyangense]MBZ8176812.1 hypothetical protein [Corynebacterium poyangense]QNQ89710.1 hypothetical protein GP475_02905 [Corynebacterium poyangense]
MRIALEVVIGAIILALGVWWMTFAQHSINGILSALVAALGGGLIVIALSRVLNIYSPTSEDLGK